MGRGAGSLGNIMPIMPIDGVGIWYSWWWCLPSKSLATDGSEQDEARRPRVEARYAPGDMRDSPRDTRPPLPARTEPEDVRRDRPAVPRLKVADRGWWQRAKRDTENVNQCPRNVTKAAQANQSR